MSKTEIRGSYYKFSVIIIIIVITDILYKTDFFVIQHFRNTEMQLDRIGPKQNSCSVLIDLPLSYYQLLRGYIKAIVSYKVCQKIILTYEKV